ncbi:MAG TPA: hypothetical protein VMG12_01315 [Polyangiaceae bacterium]|nr:hypothetical protein [Polyangiaceae bacterium]
MSFARNHRWLAARCGTALALALLAASPSARAQATSWLYVGGGAGVVDQGEQETRSTVQLDTGLGTSAEHALVAGGIFRVQGYLGAGADLGVAARLVTRGFAIGGFGAGIDAGVYQRWWGTESTGFTGNLVLGAPWGITLLGGTSIGSGDQRVYFASLGIDLARLTVHRHSGLDWFANPMRSPGE